MQPCKLATGQNNTRDIDYKNILQQPGHWIYIHTVRTRIKSQFWRVFAWIKDSVEFWPSWQLDSKYYQKQLRGFLEYIPTTSRLGHSCQSISLCSTMPWLQVSPFVWFLYCAYCSAQHSCARSVYNCSSMDSRTGSRKRLDSHTIGCPSILLDSALICALVIRITPSEPGWIPSGTCRHIRHHTQQH